MSQRIRTHHQEAYSNMVPKPLRFLVLSKQCVCLVQLQSSLVNKDPFLPAQAVCTHYGP